jgi:hypothetical protein
MFDYVVFGIVAAFLLWDVRHPRRRGTALDWIHLVTLGVQLRCVLNRAGIIGERLT